MEPFSLTSKEFFTIESWMEQSSGLLAGFSTKNGGISNGDYSGLNFGFHVGDAEKAVCGNRVLFSEKVDFPLTCWIGAEQTHEVYIQKVSKADRGRGANNYHTSFKATDGFYTSDKGTLLTLCFADCVPLYFFDVKAGIIGLAHAGWKGTVAGIGKEMISLFVKNGSSLENISVVIGPSICKECYIVDRKVIDLAEKILVGVEKKPYNQISEGQYSLDLKETNKLILMSAGIKEDNILPTNLCTSCNSNHFYSHRKDGGNTGRMIAFIGWKEDFHP
ncbi:peptidoglycan editing factor PgeF [Mesobacillus foraminis]|uniref:peptidoglycan editing factor PgeF n=1 Tax=Mesobacillus foraminis TaxID=279826 RepID=UPI00399F6356